MDLSTPDFSDWLRNGEDSPLKITAALCMGNLCSSKENCDQLMKLFAPALIQALIDHQAPLVRDVKLQHAILAALKNLAVAPEGRSFLVANGLLPPALDLVAGLSLTPVCLAPYSLCHSLHKIRSLILP